MTDRFMFWPHDIAVDTDIQTGKLCGLDDLHRATAWVKIGIELGTAEKQCKPIGVEDGTRFIEESLRENGWVPLENTTFGLPQIGEWVEGRFFSVLTRDVKEGETSTGFLWHRFSMDRSQKPVFVAVPLRKMPINVRLTKAPDGTVFLVIRDLFDGRWSVLRWDDGRLRVVVAQRSPLLLMACFDGCLLLTLFTVVPMTVLGVATWFLQRRQQQNCVVTSLQKSAVIATAFRRSIARIVDLSLTLPLIVMSLVLHPEAIDWWRDVLEARWWLWYYFQRCFNDLFGLDRGGVFMRDRPLSELAIEVSSVPVCWWLLLLGIVIVAAQVSWQGQSGQTAGKWLVKVKVVRSTLKPCGLARSLLRELLFVIDGLFLLSWVPGMCSILGTKNSQRIGDLAADTIVIRDP